MPIAMPWTSSDLELLPDDGKRYEIIDGELYVSSPNHDGRCFVCFTVLNKPIQIESWTGRG